MATRGEIRCETCGKEYSPALHIRQGGEMHTYCCFECAIHGMAPICHECGVRVIGHGTELPDGEVFCSHHCRDQHEAARAHGGRAETGRYERLRTQRRSVMAPDSETAKKRLS